jgi:hypothetical protein
MREKMRLNADNETIRTMNRSRNSDGDLPGVHETGAKNCHGEQQTAEPRLTEVSNSEQASRSWNSISRISLGIVTKGDT